MGGWGDKGGCPSRAVVAKGVVARLGRGRRAEKGIEVGQAGQEGISTLSAKGRGLLGGIICRVMKIAYWAGWWCECVVSGREQNTGEENAGGLQEKSRCVACGGDCTARAKMAKSKTKGNNLSFRPPPLLLSPPCPPLTHPPSATPRGTPRRKLCPAAPAPPSARGRTLAARTSRRGRRVRGRRHRTRRQRSLATTPLGREGSGGEG